MKHPSSRAERRHLTLVKDTDRPRKLSKKEALAAVLEKELHDEFKEFIPE